MRWPIPLVLAVLTSGCGVYLHDARNQATADAALKDFQSFREKSASPYAVMLKNLEKAKAATADAQRAAADRRVSGFSLGVAYRTWGDLDKKLEQEAERLDAAGKVVTNESQALMRDLGQAETAAAKAEADVARARAALARQFNDNQRWVAQQALFKHAIQKTAEKAAAGRSEPGLEELRDATQALLDVKVTVQEQSSTGEIVAVDKKIGDVLGIALPKDWKDFPDLVKQLSGVSLKPAASPGIAVTILGLAVDLAEAEYRREQTRIAMLQRRADVLEALQKNIVAARALVGAARQDIARFATPDERIVAGLERFGARQAADLEARFQAVALAAIALTTLASERDRLDVEIASLKHEASIRLSAVNAQAHEALIGRGLEGVTAYYRGGVTPEEIANFIRAAQAVALGVIGARL